MGEVRGYCNVVVASHQSDSQHHHNIWYWCTINRDIFMTVLLDAWWHLVSVIIALFTLAYIYGGFKLILSIYLLFSTCLQRVYTLHWRDRYIYFVISVWFCVPTNCQNTNWRSKLRIKSCWVQEMSWMLMQLMIDTLTHQYRYLSVTAEIIWITSNNI